MVISYTTPHTAEVWSHLQCNILSLHYQDGSTSCYMLAGRARSIFARCLLDRVNGVAYK